MSEWKEYRLGDLGTFFGGVTSIKREDYGFGTPFISYKNVYKNSKIDISLIELMNVKESDILKRNCLIGDIFFTASSETPDEVAMSSVLLDSVDNLTFNGFCKRFRLHNFDILIPQYARYLFRGEDFRNSAYEYANGDVRFNISQENLSKIIIKIPDLPTQTAIAEILSSLDDKIELNNKINQELEDLAQTLFKRWFIDFEFPNENGDPYKSSGGEMVDSELGEIPKGWGVSTLDNIVQISLGGTPSRSKLEFWNGNIPWVNSGKINENYILQPIEYISKLGLTKSSTKLIDKYSTLIAITGATLGQVSYSLIDACYNQSVISLSSKSEFNEFIHLLIKSIVHELIKYQTGGAQQHINKGNVENFKVKFPNQNILYLFKSNVSNLYSLIEVNLIENHSLTTLRDTLLPKLISGELEVSQIQNLP